MSKPADLSANPTEPNGPECLEIDEPTPSAVRDQLKRIVESEQFSRSERMRRFLTHIVQTALEGETEGLKEQVIASDVFEKPADFDTRLSPIVRVEARRLRSRLLEYYDQAGTDDPVLIEMPRGGYVPKFSLKTAPEPPPKTPPEDASKPPVPPYRAVAVLPFLDMSAEGDNRHFCDGLTEEVINALTRIKDLEVVARSSAFQFHGAAQDVREVGSKLGVGAVMEGSVRRSGERLRATVQLNNANNGFHIWSETFEFPAGEEFAIQDELAGQVAATLQAQRGEVLIHELTKRQTTQSEAFQHYIQGVYSSRQIRDCNTMDGVRHFRDAIAVDPSYGQAHAGLAKCLCDMAWLGLDGPGAALAEAKTAAAKALDLDEEGAGAAARAALGALYCIGDWNYEAGRAELVRALDDDPSEYLASQWYALGCLAPLGDLDKALNVMLAGSEKAGNSSLAQNHVGLIHYYAGDYVEAQRWHKAILRESPEFAQAHWDLGRVHLARQQFSEAHAALSRAVEISGGKPLFLGTLGFCEAAMGNADSAKKLAANLVKLSETMYVSPLAVAHVFLGLENKTEAFRWLHLALEERACRLVEMDNDTVYDSVRDDERFAKLREAVCLTPTAESE